MKDVSDKIHAVGHLPYILESNRHPNLISTSFCRFLKRKIYFAVLIRSSFTIRAVGVGCMESHPGEHYRQIFQEVLNKQCFGRIRR